MRKDIIKSQSDSVRYFLRLCAKYTEKLGSWILIDRYSSFAEYKLKNYYQLKILLKQKMIIVSFAINGSNINSIAFKADNTASIASFRSNFKNSKWRCLALALISLLTIRNYFCSDMPNIQRTQIKELVTHEVNSESTIKYDQLYSFVSYPNIMLPLIGGIMASKYRLYKIIVSFSLFIIVGQLIFTAAGFFETATRTTICLLLLQFLAEPFMNKEVRYSESINYNDQQMVQIKRAVTFTLNHPQCDMDWRNYLKPDSSVISRNNFIISWICLRIMSLRVFFYHLNILDLFLTNTQIR